jgi:mRNA-degrading endonuclease RelE of RelBE toxin-antitoxin system
MEKEWFEHEFIELKSFQRQIKRLCFNDDDESKIKNFVANNRYRGKPVIGKSGIRKLRIPLDDRGTRGGGRVIYYFADDEKSFILFMMIYNKGDQDDLTNEQEQILLRALDNELQNR